MAARKDHYTRNFFPALFGLLRDTPDARDKSGNLTVSFPAGSERTVRYVLQVASSGILGGKPHSDWDAGLANSDEGTVTSITFASPEDVASLDVVEQGVALIVKNKRGIFIQVPAIHLRGAEKLGDIVPNVIQPLLNLRFGDQAPIL